MDRWRLAGGCRHSRLSTVLRARGWVEATFGRPRDGPQDPGGGYFLEWLSDGQGLDSWKERMPWIEGTGIPQRRDYLGREPMSIEKRRSRLRDDGVAGQVRVRVRPIARLGCQEITSTGVSGQLRNEPPGRGYAGALVQRGRLTLCDEHLGHGGYLGPMCRGNGF